MTCVMGQFAIPGLECLARRCCCTPTRAVAVCRRRGFRPDERGRRGSPRGSIGRNRREPRGGAGAMAIRCALMAARRKACRRTCRRSTNLWAIRGHADRRPAGASGPLSTFEDWGRLSFHFNRGVRGRLAGALDDPDGDGLANLAGIRGGRSSPGRRIAAKRPGSVWPARVSAGRIDVVVSFARRKARPRTWRYEVEVRRRMGAGWGAGGAVLELGAADDGNGETETAACRCAAHWSGRGMGSCD